MLVYLFLERERDGTALLRRNVMIVVFARYMYNICAVWRTVQHSHKFISILVFELIYDALTYVDPSMLILVVFEEP